MNGYVVMNGWLFLTSGFMVGRTGLNETSDKLMEGILTGELREFLAAFAQRARKLIGLLTIDWVEAPSIPDSGGNRRDRLANLTAPGHCGIAPPTRPRTAGLCHARHPAQPNGAGRPYRRRRRRGQSGLRSPGLEKRHRTNRRRCPDPCRPTARLSPCDRRPTWRSGLHDVWRCALGRASSRRNIGQVSTFTDLIYLMS